MVDFEMGAAKLQRRRLQSAEPADEAFMLRYWADLQFLVVSLSRFRHAAALIEQSKYATADIVSALAAFDAATPSLRTMRNIGEHAHDYAVNSASRHDPTIDSAQLEVGSWDGRMYGWLKRADGQFHTLDVDAALSAAKRVDEALHIANALRPHCVDATRARCPPQ